MGYQLNRVTIRTNNSEAGMKKIGELWKDVTEGKLPLLFDSEHVFTPGLSPVSEYSNFENEEKGMYDLSIITVTADFFGMMEEKVKQGSYQKYDAKDPGKDLGECTRIAWEQVWSEQHAGKLDRAFGIDYESSVPAEYTKDGCAHCYLYISVK